MRLPTTEEERQKRARNENPQTDDVLTQDVYPVIGGDMQGNVANFLVSCVAGPSACLKCISANQASNGTANVGLKVAMRSLTSEDRDAFAVVG